mgnify:CR=1 FL=1
MNQRGEKGVIETKKAVKRQILFTLPMDLHKRVLEICEEEKLSLDYFCGWAVLSAIVWTRRNPGWSHYVAELMQVKKPRKGVSK